MIKWACIRIANKHQLELVHMHHSTSKQTRTDEEGMILRVGGIAIGEGVRWEWIKKGRELHCPCDIADNEERLSERSGAS